MNKLLFREGHPPARTPVIPPYKMGEYGRWRIAVRGPADDPVRGYFNDLVLPTHTVLVQERRQTLKTYRDWMKVGAFELDMQLVAVEEAHGHVVIAGLGTGVSVYNIASKPEVTRVTVLENDTRVMRAWKEACNWGDWPGYGKVTIWAADALGWMPGDRLLPEERFPHASTAELDAMMEKFAWTDVDFLYVDIWANPGGITALSDVSLIAANLAPRKVYYTGQEFDISKVYADIKARDPSAQMSRDMLLDWIASTNLPMAGADWPHYHTYCPVAVRNFIRSKAPKKGAKAHA